ncbi:MAG: hypothetical protein E6I87_05775 [Chloroflexi bacterium]|nr:MAG: hypothetical protein E6I87_05775 [Chloroflexota bacterium]
MASAARATESKRRRGRGARSGKLAALPATLPFRRLELSRFAARSVSIEQRALSKGENEHMVVKTPHLTRRRFLIATGALAAVACTPTSPGGGTQPSASAGKAKYGGTVTMALENDVINFDPLKSNAFVDRNVHYQIYDSLVRVDETQKIIPWLATKWDISSDGKTVTFTLRDDVTFHDGTKFDAANVKWNIERYQKTTGSARTGELASVASVDAPNATTAVFNLKAPFSPLLANLIDRAGMMVSQKAYDAIGNPDDFTRKAFKAGSGPFMLT